MLEISQKQETHIDVWAGDVEEGNFFATWEDSECLTSLCFVTKENGKAVTVTLRALDMACLNLLSEAIEQAKNYLADDAACEEEAA